MWKRFHNCSKDIKDQNMANSMRADLIPVVNQKFGYWKVIVPGTRHCQCRCSCGVEKKIYTRNLLDGRSTKCRSCSAKEQGRWLWDNKQPVKLRKAVKSAIERCTKKNHQSYHNYGGRGISIYSEWLNDPRLFVEYLTTLDGCDNPNLVIDRIDNDGNYEPGNIRFVDYSVSRRNQRGM